MKIKTRLFMIIILTLLPLLCRNVYAVSIYLDNGGNTPPVAIQVTWDEFYNLKNSGYIDDYGFIQGQLLQDLSGYSSPHQSIDYHPPHTTLFEALPYHVLHHAFQIYWRSQMPLIDAAQIMAVNRRSLEVINALPLFKGNQRKEPTKLGKKLAENLWFTTIIYPANMIRIFSDMFNGMQLHGRSSSYDIPVEYRYIWLNKTSKRVNQSMTRLPFSSNVNFTYSPLKKSKLLSKRLLKTPTDKVYGYLNWAVGPFFDRSHQRWHATITFGEYSIAMMESQTITYMTKDYNDLPKYISKQSYLHLSLSRGTELLLNKKLDIDPSISKQSLGEIFRSMEKLFMSSVVPISPAQFASNNLQVNSRFLPQLPYPGFNRIPNNTFIRNLLLIMLNNQPKSHTDKKRQNKE